MDEDEPRSITAEDGSYDFSGLVEGSYVIREVPRDGWMQVAPTVGSFMIDLAAGESLTDLNFVNRRTDATVVEEE